VRFAVICFALIFGLSASAAAHGRPPYVERIAFDPNDPDRIVLQFSFGLVVTEDGGASWAWICGAAYGIDAGWEDPDITITGDGSTLIGTFTTAVRAAADLCTFEQPGGSIADTEVIDLAADPHDPDVVWALTTRGGGETELLQRTTDGGVVTPPPTGCGCSAAGGDGGGLFALAFAAVIARLLRRRT